MKLAIITDDNHIIELTDIEVTSVENLDTDPFALTVFNDVDRGAAIEDPHELAKLVTDYVLRTVRPDVDLSEQGHVAHMETDGCPGCKGAGCPDCEED